MKKIIPLLMLTILLGCDDTNQKIGSNETGKRIPLLTQTRKPEADKDLTGLKLVLPEITNTTSWSEVGYDTSHLIPNSALSGPLKVRWSENIGEGSSTDYKLLATPVAANGFIYTLDAEGNVTALNAETGDRLWDFDTIPENRDENAIGGGLALSDNSLFVTTGFGEVLSLDVKDGSVRWRRILSNPLRAAPTVEGGRVYVVSIDNELTALDARTGQVLWHHNGIAESATLMGASSPAASGESVVVAYSSGEIYSLRTENGRASWNYVLSAPAQIGALPAIADIRGLPVLDHGRIYAISHSGRLASVDQRTGDRVWETDIGGINTPVLALNALFILSSDGHLIALDRESGRIVWVHELQHNVDRDDRDSPALYWTGPIWANNRLVLVNSKGHVVFFSPDDGSEVQIIKLDEAIFVPPIVVNNTLYVVTDDAHLIAVK